MFYRNLRVLGGFRCFGSRVYGLRFSATCVNLDGNIGVNGAIYDAEYVFIIVRVTFHYI